MTDVGDPDHGTVVIRDGEVVYTPEPDYVGTVEIPITITDRDGNITRTVLTLNVGEEQTSRVGLPDRLVVGDNLVLAGPAVTNARQRATLEVICTPRMRMSRADGIGLCSTYRTGGRTYLWVSAPATVRLTLTAPKRGTYGALFETRTYKVR